jgi:hypothetical protein
LSQEAGTPAFFALFMDERPLSGRRPLLSLSGGKSQSPGFVAEARKIML